MDLVIKSKYFFGLIFLPFFLFSMDSENLILPDGFNASLFVNNIDSPRQMAEGSNGFVFVGSSSGKVYALKDHDKNGEIDKVEVIAEGFGDS